MARRIRICSLSLVLLCMSGAAPATKPAFTPTADYTRKTIRGWSVLVNNELLAKHPKVAADCLELLDHKLYDITRVVPPKALEKLQRVPIWLESNDPLFPGGCYHPSRQWLIEHGLNPEKAKGVELANARNFLKWTIDQPSMVLHELAHAYHDQVLGYDHAEVHAAYVRAKESKSYDSILRGGGRMEKAYAMNNDQEYFAELTEAYFGTNDFYPFVRAEVKQYDPKMYELLKKVWEE